MTLKQAFTEWAAMPENTAQAARNRSAVDSILLQKYGKSDVCEFTAFRVRKIMDGLPSVTDSIKGMKVRTASILVQVLTFAASKGACLKPEFDHTIANIDNSVSTTDTAQGSSTDPESPTKGSTPKNSVKQERPSEASHQVFGQESSEGAIAPEPPLRNKKEKYPSRFKPGHVPATKGKKWDEIMSKDKQDNCKKGWKNVIEHRPPHSPNSGRKKVPVVQLNPKTYQVVASYDCMSDAGRASGTGARNVSRAVKVKGMTGGFYWCLKGEESGFKPGRRVKILKKNKGSRMPEDNEVVGCAPTRKALTKNTAPAGGPGKSPTDKSASERGSAMSQTSNATVLERTPLSFYTAQELRAELEHRGWYGTLYQRLDFMANRQQEEI